MLRGIVSDLHICGRCVHGRSVYAARWDETEDGKDWVADMRCPDCEHWRYDVHLDNATVEAYDDRENELCEAVLLGLRDLSRANMRDDCERFADAIHRGAVLPIDF